MLMIFQIFLVRAQATFSTYLTNVDKKKANQPIQMLQADLLFTILVDVPLLKTGHHLKMNLVLFASFLSLSRLPNKSSRRQLNKMFRKSLFWPINFFEQIFLRMKKRTDGKTGRQLKMNLLLFALLVVPLCHLPLCRKEVRVGNWIFFELIWGTELFSSPSLLLSLPVLMPSLQPEDGLAPEDKSASATEYFLNWFGEPSF